MLGSGRWGCRVGASFAAKLPAPWKALSAPRLRWSTHLGTGRAAWCALSEPAHRLHVRYVAIAVVACAVAFAARTLQPQAMDALVPESLPRAQQPTRRAMAALLNSMPLQCTICA